MPSQAREQAIELVLDRRLQPAERAKNKKI
jgi:hypothetical protein